MKKMQVTLSCIAIAACTVQANLLTDPSFETGETDASIYKFTNDPLDIPLTSSDLNMWISREAAYYATKFMTTDIGPDNAGGYTAVVGQTGNNSALLRSKDKRGMVQVVTANVLAGEEVGFSADFALVGTAVDIGGNVQVIGFNDFTGLTCDIGGRWVFTGGTYDVLINSAVSGATYGGTTYKEFAVSGTAAADYTYLGLIIGGDGGVDNSFTDFVAFDNVQLGVQKTSLSYANWVNSYPTLGGSTNHLDDFEPDGMNNLLEFALGGNPTNADATIIMPVSALDEEGGTNYLNYVYRRSISRTAQGLSYTVVAGTDLASNNISNATEQAGSVDLGDGFESVTNRVPTDTESKQFMKLEVEIGE